MTYQEYQNQEAALKAALASLQQQYMAEHGLAVGTRVRYQGQLGYVDRVWIWEWDGNVVHSISVAKKDGTMAKKGKNLAYGARIHELEVS